MTPMLPEFKITPTMRLVGLIGRFRKYVQPRRYRELMERAERCHRENDLAAHRILVAEIERRHDLGLPMFKMKDEDGPNNLPDHG